MSSCEICCGILRAWPCLAAITPTNSAAPPSTGYIASLASRTSTRSLHDEAIAHIQDAQSHWEAYAAILDKHYRPQLLSRTHYLDWNSILNNGMGIQAAHFGVRRETKDISEKAYRKKQSTQKKKRVSKHELDDARYSPSTI